MLKGVTVQMAEMYDVHLKKCAVRLRKQKSMMPEYTPHRFKVQNFTNLSVIHLIISSLVSIYTI